ncbi:MAG TPA: tetratricopeptide repeat protein [bacterium]|nr:tetratricopeptide repeat protein [bacterium]
MMTLSFFRAWRRPWLWVLLALFAARAQAQTATGGTISPFELGGSARALGMGDAAGALTGDGDGFFNNPAILATLKEHQILTFHAPLFGDTNYDAAAYTHPLGPGNSFGLALARLAVDGVPLTEDNILPTGTFTAEEYQALLGYGFRLTDEWDLGATVKYIREQFNTYEGSGVGLDLGILYHFGKSTRDFSQLGVKNLTLGVGFSNVLQPEVRLVQTPDTPDRVLRPSLSYLFLPPGTRDQLWLVLESQVPVAGMPDYRGGAEYAWNETAFLRAGFDGVGPTAGAGLRISDFQLDYAFNQRDLGALHRFSLSYRFDQVRDKLETQRIDLLKWVAKSYDSSNDYGPALKAWENVRREFPDDNESARALQDLQRRRKSELEKQLRAAQNAMERGDMERALPLVARALALDPSNPTAKALLRQVDRKAILSTNYTKGVEAYSREDYKQAIEYLQEVYEIDPHYRDVNFLYRDAQSHYLPLESMSKESTELYAKGVEAYMKGDFRRAVDCWGQVMEKNPKNFLVRRNLEEAKERLKEKPSAESPANP